jgi:hypothetical protein
MLRLMHASSSLAGRKKLFRLSATAQEIVDVVWDVLEAGVALHDAHKAILHTAVSDGWMSTCTAEIKSSDDRRWCGVAARVNDRWTLIVSSGVGLHPDAEALAQWAADKLAPYLPRTADEDDDAVPPFGGGGPTGSAEAGIPVWWARKVRN